MPPVLLLLRFSREFGLVFFVGLRVFLKTLRVACFNLNLLVFWSCFLQISVLWIAFFSNVMALLLFQFTFKA